MKKLCFLLISLLFISKTSNASHAMGADMTYRCLGVNQYEITYTFYRDCSGINAPSNVSINISSSCFPDTNIIINPLPSSPTQISPVCPTAVTTCNGGSNLGLEEWVYQGIITLPGPCSNWQFSHSENARNAAITTITGNGGDDLYVYSILNNTNGICNNSPKFSNKPIIFSCLGQPFYYNNGAYDSEGDSLTYQIITPRNGPQTSDTVTYHTGFSATQPIHSNPPMYFNSATGGFYFTATQTDITVLAILVSEFRNGILIGQIERDIQLIVSGCNNNLPSLTGVNGTPNFNLNVCANELNCFYVRSMDLDTANTTIISWDNSVAGVSFSHTQGHRDSAYFCWTPLPSDTVNNPHCFTVTLRDDNCDFYGVQTYTYCLTVDNSDNCIPSTGIRSVYNELPLLNIYPQPAMNYLNIDIGSDYVTGNDQVIIYNILGETILKYAIHKRITKIDLDINGGIYIVCLENKFGEVVKRSKILISP